MNAIYSGAKGAKLMNITELNGETWVVDCDVELNISFKIGGLTYPIHPMDVTQPMTDDNGKTFCFGTVRVTSLHSFVRRLTIDHRKFQTVIPGAQDPTFDGVLGMTFCK